MFFWIQLTTGRRKVYRYCLSALRPRTKEMLDFTAEMVAILKDSEGNQILISSK